MRCDQFMGLNPWAQKLVDGRQVLLYTEYVTRKYPGGNREVFPEHQVFGSSTTKIRYSTYYGMFNNEYPLYRYTLEEGAIYEEFVQSAPWSSGPVFFLALQTLDSKPVKKSLWPQNEIDGA
jgi:hypothetical protein